MNVWETLSSIWSSIWGVLRDGGITRRNSWSILDPIAWWIALQIWFIGLIVLIYYTARKSKFSILFDMIYQQMYEFFEDIVGTQEKKWIKSYIISVFFVILLANISWVIIDFIKFPFEGLENYIEIPTANFGFTIAMSVVSVVILLFIQLTHLWPIKFVHEYIPFTGKGILAIEKGTMSTPIYYMAWAFVKIFDLAISLFVWFLDIIGIAAKIISLAARLFGNIFSWPILLWMLVFGLAWATQNLVWFDLPIIAPLILYLYGLLVAAIQAFVFPLLIGIFIKVAQSDA